MNESASFARTPQANRPQLKRVLGRGDLVLLFVVAVFNLNVVPSIAATLTLLIAVGKDQINVLQGIMQAVSHMAKEAGIAWIAPGFALPLSLSIAGIGSAWLGGSARIPFVAGLDSYLPDWLGKVHPQYATPYAAIIVHAAVSMVLVVMNFAGAGVPEAFQTMLSLAGVLQLVPFLYMFGALVKFAFRYERDKSHHSQPVLFLAGLGGLTTTTLGIVLVFFPARQITSLLWYELNMVGGTVVFLGLAAFFFFVYGRRKASRSTRVVWQEKAYENKK